MAAYRPNPIDFPERLTGLPPGEARTRSRATNGIVVLMTGLMGLLVSGAYVRLSLETMSEVWKPGIGVGVSLLIVWLAIWTIRNQSVFVRRGEWIAIYEKDIKVKVISVGEIVGIKLNAFQTVRLTFASIVVTLIGLIGLPVYLFTGGPPEFMPATWLIAALTLGLTLGYDIIVGRFSSTTIRIGSGEYLLPKRFIAIDAGSEPNR